MSSTHHLTEKGIITTLNHCVQDILENTCRINFSQDPDNEEKQIIEFKSRMRVFGLEKFNGPCYIAAINFFADAAGKEKNDPIGAMILFLDEENVLTVIKPLTERGFDDEDEEQVLAKVGEFGVLLATAIKEKLANLGYGGMVLSDPMTYSNDIPEGIPFKATETGYFENSYYAKRQKILVLDFTLAPPR